MIYSFIYEPDYPRIINAVLIDNRASIPEIKNQIGSIIRSYIDSQLLLINDNCITYKIETEIGVLAGYFVVEINDVMFFFFTVKRPRLLMKQLRPAFKSYSDEITAQISSFISNNLWKPDVL